MSDWELSWFDETKMVKVKNSNRVKKYYRKGGIEDGDVNVAIIICLINVFASWCYSI